MIMTIGIDPGLSGAIGFLLDGRFHHVVDMPTMLKGGGSVKNEVNPAELRSLLRDTIQGDVVMVVIERVNAMPGQGVSSVFSIGDSFGTARGVVSCLSLEHGYVSPVTWKKHFKLSSNKEEARALATRMFPTAPLGLKKHSDRAESLLMARWVWDKLLSR